MLNRTIHFSVMTIALFIVCLQGSLAFANCDELLASIPGYKPSALEELNRQLELQIENALAQMNASQQSEYLAALQNVRLRKLADARASITKERTQKGIFQITLSPELTHSPERFILSLSHELIHLEKSVTVGDSRNVIKSETATRSNEYKILRATFRDLDAVNQWAKQYRSLKIFEKIDPVLIRLGYFETFDGVKVADRPRALASFASGRLDVEELGALTIGELNEFEAVDSFHRAAVVALSGSRENYLRFYLHQYRREHLVNRVFVLGKLALASGGLIGAYELWSHYFAALVLR